MGNYWVQILQVLLVIKEGLTLMWKGQLTNLEDMVYKSPLGHRLKVSVLILYYGREGDQCYFLSIQHAIDAMLGAKSFHYHLKCIMLRVYK